MEHASNYRDEMQTQPELSAQASEGERLRLLLNAITDYAICMLDRNGYVSSWNAGAQRIKGYGAEEILGEHFSRFYTEGDRANGLPEAALHCVFCGAKQPVAQAAASAKTASSTSTPSCAASTRRPRASRHPTSTRATGSTRW